MHVHIYSQCDGWDMQVLDAGDVVRSFSWNHNDSEEGAGGEKVFAQLLNFLGHTTYQEDVY